MFRIMNGQPVMKLLYDRKAFETAQSRFQNHNWTRRRIEKYQVNGFGKKLVGVRFILPFGRRMKKCLQARSLTPSMFNYGRRRKIITSSESNKRWRRLRLFSLRKFWK